MPKSFAKKHDLSVGSPVTILTPTGGRATFRVHGIFDPPNGNSAFGNVTISAARFDQLYPQPQNIFSIVKMRGGETAANRAALRRALGGFPGAKVQTRQQFIDGQISGLSSVLNILYVLLGLSIIISLFGIVNTLVLSVFERTREIGMLRAVGTSRRQIRRMIRHESVITALIGSVLGIVLGIAFGALLCARVSQISFTIPVGRLIVFLIASWIVGLIAAIFPRARAPPGCRRCRRSPTSSRRRPRRRTAAPRPARHHRRVARVRRSRGRAPRPCRGRSPPPTWTRSAAARSRRRARVGARRRALRVEQRLLARRGAVAAPRRPRAPVRCPSASAMSWAIAASDREAISGCSIPSTCTSVRRPSPRSSPSSGTSA